MLCGDSGRVDVAGECYRTRFLSSAGPPCKPWLPRRPTFPPAPSRPCPFPSASPHNSLLGSFSWCRCWSLLLRAGAAPLLAFSGCPTTIFPHPSPHPQATHSPPPCPLPQQLTSQTFLQEPLVSPLLPIRALPPYASLAQGVPQPTPLLLPPSPTTHFLGFSAGAAGFSSAAGAGAASSAGLGLGLGLAFGFSAGAAPGCSPASTFYKTRAGEGIGQDRLQAKVPG